MYIDAHTHNTAAKTHPRIIVGIHTFGIHPWELLTSFSRNNFDESWQRFKDKKNYYVVGECGLDRAREGLASIEDQKHVLIKHLELAEEKKKPIVLHTVRAFSDLLGILKKMKFTQHIMLHDFSGNEVEMKELLKYPVFFSYGSRIFKNNQMLKLTPRECLLFETDDQTEFSIEDIYKKASESLECNMEELQAIVEKNFLRFLGQLDNVSTADFIKN